MPESSFDCQRCGLCCQGTGGIVLTAGDCERLAAHLDMDVTALLADYAEEARGKLRLRTRPDGFCVFYQADRGCGVHPGRPDICRAWPYFRGNLVDAVSWKMMQEDCKGISAHVPHATFVREGLAYLEAHGLIQEPGPEAPLALVLADLLAAASARRKP